MNKQLNALFSVLIKALTALTVMVLAICHILYCQGGTAHVR